jgi:hypothetical protein
VTGGLSNSGRFLLYVTSKNGRTTLHSPDLAGELNDTPTAPPSGCQWRSGTWAQPDADGRRDMVVAAVCGTDTRLYRLDNDALHPRVVGHAGSLNVTSLDYGPDFATLLLGITDPAGEDEAFTWHAGTVGRIPGLAQRPTW